MNKVQVNGMAEILGVTFRPASSSAVGRICYNNHRDHRCDNKATEEAVIQVGQNAIAIRTCSNAYCRIAAAIDAWALSQPLSREQREMMKDTEAQEAIRSRANRSLAILEEHMSRKFERRISFSAQPSS